MMHHEAGVRTVVVGGQPSYKPMQAQSGTRGARYYTSVDVDTNFNYTEIINATTANYLPSRSDNDFYVIRLGLNLRDQIRKDEYVPLQFIYEAANCRIFYTPQTIYNYTNLWKYAVNAINSKPELCVQGSTGHVTSNATNTPSPVSTKPFDINVFHNVSGILRVSGSAGDFNAVGSGGVSDGVFPIAQLSGRPVGTPPKTVTTQTNGKVKRTFRQKNRKLRNSCIPGDPSCIGTKTGPLKPTGPPKLTGPSNPDNSLVPLPPLDDGSRGNFLARKMVEGSVMAGIMPWD